MSATYWSGEPIVAERKDIQASSQLALHRGGRLAALASRLQTVLLDLSQPTVTVHALSTDSKYDVSAAQWSRSDDEPNLLAVTYSQQLSILRCGDGGGSLTNLTQLLHVPAHRRHIADLDWHWRRPLVATCSVDASVAVWDVRADMKRPAIAMSSVESANQVKWNRLSDHTLASSHEGDIRVWDTRQPSAARCYIPVHAAKIHGLDWSPWSEHELATAGQDMYVKFVDVNNARVITSMPKSRDPVWRARYTPFGRAFVTEFLLPNLRRGDNSLCLWCRDNLANPVHTFVGHSDVVLEFDWRYREDDDEYDLVTWSRDQSVRMWQVERHMLQLCGHVLPPPSTAASVSAANGTLLGSNNVSQDNNQTRELAENGSNGEHVTTAKSVSSILMPTSGSSMASVASGSDSATATPPASYDPPCPPPAAFYVNATQSYSPGMHSSSQGTASADSTCTQQLQLVDTSPDPPPHPPPDAGGSLPQQQQQQSGSLQQELDALVKLINNVNIENIADDQCSCHLTITHANCILRVAITAPSPSPQAPLSPVPSPPPPSSVAGAAPPTSNTLSLRILDTGRRLTPAERLQLLNGWSLSCRQLSREHEELGSWRQLKPAMKQLVATFEQLVSRQTGGEVVSGLTLVTLRSHSTTNETVNGHAAATNLGANVTDDGALGSNTAAATSTSMQTHSDRRRTQQAGVFASANVYSGFRDMHVPFPRTSGARFCSNGVLCVFACPMYLKHLSTRGESVTPRSLSALDAYLVNYSQGPAPRPLMSSGSLFYALSGNSIGPDATLVSKLTGGTVPRRSKTTIQFSDEERLSASGPASSNMSTSAAMPPSSVTIPGHTAAATGTSGSGGGGSGGHAVSRTLSAPLSARVGSAAMSRECAGSANTNSTSSSGGGGAGGGLQMPAVVMCYDVARLMLLERGLAARSGVVAARSLQQFSATCSEHAARAVAAGRADLDKVWHVLAVCAEAVASTATSGGDTAQHVIARQLVDDLLSHYLRVGDIQTVATVVCNLAELAISTCPVRAYLVQSTPAVPPVDCRTDAKAPVFPTPGESPYHTIHPPDRRRYPTLFSPMHVMAPRQSRSNSWTDDVTNMAATVSDRAAPAVMAPPPGSHVYSALSSPGEVNVRSLTPAGMSCVTAGGGAAVVKKALGCVHTRLLEPSRYDQLENYIRLYAEILYRWNLLEQRAKVLKFTSVVTVSRQYGVKMLCACGCCGHISSSVTCCVCSRYSVTCVICRVPVRGMAVFCLSCGHGGHLRHVQQWFEVRSTCPAGCNCQCIDSFRRVFESD